MPQPRWAHTLSRKDDNAAPDMEAYVAALVDRIEPNPSSACTTAKNEAVLEIDCRHVYFFLGRTTSRFGDVSISLTRDATIAGTLSPFDTGGLVKHHRPACGWESRKRVQYLGSFSWPVEESSDRLARYPGDKEVCGWSRYFKGERPLVSGPEEIWPCEMTDAAGIWAEQSENGWEAWTWELRVPESVKSPPIYYWTCPDHLRAALDEWAMTSASPERARQYLQIAERFCPRLKFVAACRGEESCQ
ncbi:MAG: hypothetical protein V3V08_00540 [Nannocystaceae bacterium]